MIQKIKHNLAELGFSNSEVKVYIALTQLGESSAAKIAKKANLPRTTVISILAKLRDEKYISSHIYRHMTYYWIESPKTIADVFAGRLGMAQELDELLSDMYRSEADFPHAQVYDSKASIKAFMEKAISNLEKNASIFTIDTPSEGNYRKIFSDDFGKILVQLKNKKGIVTHTLVPAGSFAGIDPTKLKTQSIIIREMPEEIQFKTSLWLIDDMLVLFSGKYPFVVAVRHKLITTSMQSVFDFVWNVSKEMNYPILTK